MELERFLLLQWNLLPPPGNDDLDDDNDDDDDDDCDDDDDDHFDEDNDGDDDLDDDDNVYLSNCFDLSTLSNSQQLNRVTFLVDCCSQTPW